MEKHVGEFKIIKKFLRIICFNSTGKEIEALFFPNKWENCV
jgi:hypothetical protein